MCCECDDDYSYDWDGSNLRKTNMKQSYFAAGSSYATEDEAISAAKKRSAKYFEDVNIYKAYKVAKTTTPNVEVTDITV